MKKLLSILVFGLILNINPIITQSAFSFFKSPVETCMDKLEDEGFHIRLQLTIVTTSQKNL